MVRGYFNLVAIHALAVKNKTHAILRPR